MGALRKIGKIIGNATGVSPAAKFAARQVGASLDTVAGIKNDISSFASQVNHDLSKVNEFMNEDRTVDLTDPSNRYRNEVLSRRFTHIDIKRIIRRSATSAWVSGLAGILGLIAACVTLHPIYALFSVILFISSLRHGFINWMHRNQKLTTFKEYWSAPDFFPKWKR